MINTMTDKNLNELLTELNDALEKIEEIDPETRALVKDLDEDINRLLEPKLYPTMQAIANVYEEAIRRGAVGVGVDRG